LSAEAVGPHPAAVCAATVFGFDCELLAACQHQRLTIKEVPVCVRLDKQVEHDKHAGQRRACSVISWRIRRDVRGYPSPTMTDSDTAALKKAA